MDKDVLKFINLGEEPYPPKNSPKWEMAIPQIWKIINQKF